jgi:hypothetical protein
MYVGKDGAKFARSDIIQRMAAGSSRKQLKSGLHTGWSASTSSACSIGKRLPEAVNWRKEEFMMLGLWHAK